MPLESNRKRWRKRNENGYDATCIYATDASMQLRLHVIFGGMKGSTYYLFEAKNIIHNRIKGKKARAFFFSSLVRSGCCCCLCIKFNIICDPTHTLHPVASNRDFFCICVCCGDVLETSFAPQSVAKFFSLFFVICYQRYVSHSLFPSLSRL